MWWFEWKPLIRRTELSVFLQSWCEHVEHNDRGVWHYQGAALQLHPPSNPFDEEHEGKSKVLAQKLWSRKPSSHDSQDSPSKQCFGLASC